MDEDVYTVWDEHFGELRRELHELNNHAHDRGVPAIKLRVNDEEDWVEADPSSGHQAQHRRYRFQLIGQAPREAGWEFCALIDHSIIGDIVRRVPGSSRIQLKPYWESEGTWCDHCRSDHSRVATLIARNAQGKERRVGWSCVSAFIEHGDYERLLEELRHVRDVLGAVGEAVMQGPGKGKTLSAKPKDPIDAILVKRRPAGGAE